MLLVTIVHKPEFQMDSYRLKYRLKYTSNLKVAERSTLYLPFCITVIIRPTAQTQIEKLTVPKILWHIIYYLPVLFGIKFVIIGQVGEAEQRLKEIQFNKSSF